MKATLAEITCTAALTGSCLTRVTVPKSLSPDDQDVGGKRDSWAITCGMSCKSYEPFAPAKFVSQYIQNPEVGLPHLVVSTELAKYPQVLTDSTTGVLVRVN